MGEIKETGVWEELLTWCFFFTAPGNIAAVLPTYLSQWVTKKVKALGVNVHPQTRVVAATMDGMLEKKKASGTRLSSGA